MQEVSNAEVNRRSTLRAKFLQGTFACVLLVIGSALFFTGRDNWKRSLLEPTADAAYYYVYRNRSRGDSVWQVSPQVSSEMLG